MSIIGLLLWHIVAIKYFVSSFLCFGEVPVAFVV